MINYRYHRQVNLIVASLEISEPKISATVEYDTTSSQNKADINVYNLSPEHVARVQELGLSQGVILEAGYPTTRGVIFRGIAQRILQGREGLSQVTSIRGGDSSYSPAFGRSSRVTMRSYSGAVSTRQIAGDVASDMGVPVRNLTDIPIGSTSPNFAFAGTAAAAMTALLQPHGITWYSNSEQIGFNIPGRAPSGAPRIILSEQTGMIGSPKRTDDGAEVTMFLDPRIVVGAVIELRSRFLGGQWKVVSYRHIVNNREGDFTTWCDLRGL